MTEILKSQRPIIIPIELEWRDAKGTRFSKVRYVGTLHGKYTIYIHSKYTIYIHIYYYIQKSAT